MKKLILFVAAGSTWNTPKPSCGISTPLFRVTEGTGELGAVIAPR